jgi:hypothetical protein
MYQPYQSHSRQCERCLNLIERTRRRCVAFPDGIPAELWNDEIEHSRPFPGDGGVMYEENTLKSMNASKRATRQARS